MIINILHVLGWKYITEIKFILMWLLNLLNTIFGLYCGLHWTTLVYVILFSLLEPFWSSYCQLGCFRVQVTGTATQCGVNNKEMCYLTEKTGRGWEEQACKRAGSTASLGPGASHFSTLLSPGSAQGRYISVEAPKVTCRHFQCPEETTGELPFITSLIRSGEIFSRSIPPALMSTWPELAHIVHAVPLTG